MGDKRQANKKKGKQRSRPGKARNSHPTIGLLIGDVSDSVSWDAWAGAESAAREAGANLITVAGGALDSPDGFDAQGNVLYDLVGDENVDGLVIWGGGLGQYAGVERVKALCDRVAPLPIANATMPLGGIPSVFVSNYEGMRAAMLHLVEAHGFRRIAFIRGPEGHPEAEERYRAYKEVLDQFSLPFAPTLVAPGGFSRESGVQAIELFFGERKLRPNLDIQAIVAVDDSTALGALEALQARAILVPDQVALVGFDDTTEASFSIPSLTTVPSLMHEQARRAVVMLLSKLAGEDVPEQVSLPTELLVRESCGCMEPAIAQSVVEFSSAPKRVPESASGPDRQKVIASMKTALGPAAVELEPGWATMLLDSFATDVQGQTRGMFLSSLRQCLRRAIAAGYGVRSWQKVLSEQRRRVLPFLEGDKTVVRAENLWQQARVMVSGVAERAQAQHALIMQHRAETLRGIGQLLAIMVDIEGLTDVLAEELPEMDIRGCYLSLYENPREPGESARLILAYDADGRIELEPGGQRFASHELVPGGVIDRKGRCSLSLLPLYFREDQVGFFLLDVSPRYAQDLAALRAEVSSAIQKIILYQRVESRALQLQTASEVSRAAGSILDPDELIQQAVDLAQERFALYYAGLFLVDPTGEWAKLRAGTGLAGEQMVAEGHKLRVGGESMVGSCIDRRQARIALDVGEEAVRFENPLLPHTRSEMALPLISRGQVVGAFTVQSTEEAAFSDEDVAILQTMADQVANAIVNARLYDQAQREIVERRRSEEALERRRAQLQCLSDIGQKIGESPPVDEFLQWVAERIPGAMQYPELCVSAIELEGQIYGEAEALSLSRQMVQRVSVGGERVGRVTIAYREEREFPDEASALLGDIARRVSGYLENQRLLEGVQARAGELAILNEMAGSLTEILHVQEVIERLYHYTSQLIHATDFYVALYDADTNEVSFPLAYDQGERKQWQSRQAGEGLTEYVIHSRKPLLLEDNVGERLQALGVAMIGAEAQSWLGVPMLRGEQVIGVIAVQSYTTPRLYNGRQRDLLSAVAGQAAIAIENARLLAQTQSALTETGEQAHRLALLNEMGELLSRAEDIEEVLNISALQVSEIVPSDRGSVALLTPDGNQFEILALQGEQGAIPVGAHLPVEGTAIGQALRENRLVITPDTRKSDFLDLASMAEAGILSTMTAPLVAGGRQIGTLNVGRAQADAYRRRDGDLLAQTASLLSSALENRRLFDQTERALTETEEQAHRLALLNELSQELGQAANLEEILDVAARKTARMLPSDRSSIAIVTEGGDQFEIIALQGAAGATPTGTLMEIEGSEMGIALRENRLVLLSTEPREHLGGIRSFIVAPLFVGRDPFGVLNVASKKPDAYTRRDGDLLLQTASLLSSAIENRRLFEQTQEALSQTEALYTGSDQVIRAGSTADVLNAVVQTTALQRLDRVSVAYFDQPWEDEMPGEAIIVAAWERSGEEPRAPVGTRYPLAQFPAINELARSGTTIFRDIMTDERVDEALRSLLVNTLGVKSMGLWRLMAGGQWVGVLTGQSSKVLDMDESEARQVSSLVDQAAAVVQTQRLVEQTQAALAETRGLYDANRRLTEASDLQEIVAAVVEGVPVPIINRAVLWEIERDAAGKAQSFSALANWHSGHGTPSLPLGTRFPVEQFPATRLVLSNEAMFIDDVPNDDRLDPATKSMFQQQNARALAILPLWSGPLQIGSLMLVAEEPHPFSEAEIRPYLLLAGQMAVAVENRRLFEQTQRQLTDLEAIQTTVARLTAAPTFDEAIDALLPQALSAVQADSVVISLVEDEQLSCVGMLPPDAREGWYVGRVDSLADFPMTKRIVETRQPQVGSASDPEIQPHARASFEASGITANATIPLVGRDAVVGILSVNLKQPGRSFSEHDVGLLTTLADQATTALEKSRLFEQIQQRSVQLRAATEVARAASSILDLNTLLVESVNLIRDQFDYYYAGLFLVNEGGRAAILRAATGEAGQAMLERGHRFTVGGQSMIGKCVADGQPRIALDVGEEAVRFENPLLPDTRSEMALPLISRGKVVGALSIQSAQEAAFTEEDVAVLQTMASQLATSIENARLFEQTQMALQEMEDTQRRYMEQAWQDYTTGKAQVLGYTRSREGQGVTSDAWLPAMTSAVEQAETVIEYGQDEGAALALPLTLHGEVVGALGGYRPEGGGWTEDEIRAAEAIVEQMALALESQRLFEDEQRARHLLDQQVKRVDCLNAIGQRIGESPPIAEFLEWVTERIPQAMTYAGLCVAAIDYEDRIYGAQEAKALPCQMVQGLIVGGEQVGRVTIAYSEEREFLNDESALLGDIARRVGGYIENTLLLEETRRRAEEQAALNEMSQSLAARLDTGQVLEETYRGASRLLDTSHFSIALYDEKKDTFTLALHVTDGEMQKDVFTRQGVLGMSGYIITNRVPVLVRDNVREWQDEHGIAVETFGERIPPLCWLGVPLLIGDRVLGTMFVQSLDTPWLYDEHDRDIMVAISAQAAIALENARLFEEAEIRAEEQAILAEMGQFLAASQDLDAVLEQAYLGVSRLLDASGFYITLYNSETGESTVAIRVIDGQVETPRTAEPIRRGGLTDYLVNSGQPLLLSDKLSERMEELGVVQIPLQAGRGAESWLGAPIMVGDQVLGTMVVLSYTTASTYDAHSQDLLVAAANQTALALQNIRSFEETQAALAEVEATHRSYLRQAWKDHLRQREILERSGFYYDQSLATRPEDAIAVPDLWRPEMEQALLRGGFAEVQGGDAEGQWAGLAMPITVRGETIGVLGVEAPSDEHEWTEEDRLIIEAIGEQLAQTLESARLFADTQRRAERERLIAEITAKMRASTAVRDILETAATELGQALGISRALVRLGVETEVEQVKREQVGGDGE